MTELLLQKQPDRFAAYRRPPGIWLSPGSKRWMVTAPDLIREVMTNDAFAVPSYDISQLTARLNIDLAVLNRLRNWLPLAHEGERHRELRASFARAIAARTDPALGVLRQALEDRRSVFDQPAGSEVCLFSTLFRPALRQAIASLSGVPLPEGLAVEVIPQLFDDTISLSRRRRINATLEAVSSFMPASLSDDERQIRMAIIALSANTLLGSTCLTFIEQLGGAPGTPLSGIDWGRDLVRTALPLVEKRVVKPVQLGGQPLKPGDRLRLFIEAAGFTPEGRHCYDDLFFAVGVHKCVGMNFSIKAWQAVAGFLSSVNRSVKLEAVTERDGDYVFNLPERIVVKLDA
jgi:cytochrome P450